MNTGKLAAYSLSRPAAATVMLIDNLRRLSAAAIRKLAADLVIDAGPHEGTVAVVIPLRCAPVAGGSRSRIRAHRNSRC